jgi:hypothetical protein
MGTWGKILDAIIQAKNNDMEIHFELKVLYPIETGAI